MIHANFEKVKVLVDYNASTKTLADNLGINGHVREVICCQPDWNIQSQEKISDPKTLQEIVFFEYGEGFVSRRILGRMSLISLRPVIFPEFVAAIQNNNPLSFPIACLGTMWGGLGKEQLLFLHNNTGFLAPFGIHWKPNTRFLAIHSSGKNNPLPGIISR